jgi:hypothetical protein
MKQYKDTDYYITENGEVYSKKYHPSHNPNCELRKMKPWLNGNGKKRYLHVEINDKAIKVHRLVAEVYLPNPDNLPIVEHRDDIKTNNHVSNLMWSTHKQNIKTAIKNGLIPKGEECTNSKLTEEQVKWIRENHVPRNRQFSIRALARKFGIGNTVIHNIIHNKKWKHI